MTLGQRIFNEKEFEVFGGINLPVNTMHKTDNNALKGYS